MNTPAATVTHQVAQRFIAAALVMYILCISIASLTKGTILTGGALSIFVINAILLAAYNASIKTPLQFSILKSVAYLAGSLVIWTIVLFAVTDIWKPDNFVYSLEEPGTMAKFVLLFTMQVPWAAAGLALSIIIAVLPASIFQRTYLNGTTTDIKAADSI